mmetsp:Transcript_14890/g.44566  ORF Transcript_14890/g.44566 Transcript_14890/m.44566 type:complete len:201 (-) Transcript_14890:372-974(-)
MLPLISLTWKWPPAERPMKPRATSEIHESISICLRLIMPRPKGPQSRPKPRKSVIDGKPGRNSEMILPNVWPAMQMMAKVKEMSESSVMHAMMHPAFQHAIIPADATHVGAGGGGAETMWLELRCLIGASTGFGRGGGGEKEATGGRATWTPTTDPAASGAAATSMRSAAGVASSTAATWWTTGGRDAAGAGGAISASAT